MRSQIGAHSLKAPRRSTRLHHSRVRLRKSGFAESFSGKRAALQRRCCPPGGGKGTSRGRGLRKRDSRGDEPRQRSVKISKSTQAGLHDGAILENPSAMGEENAEDARWMRRALAEAARARGRTGSNPAVGAVIVKNRRMLAAGFHRGAGCPHAEIEALRALGHPSHARGATMYVTLEPCSTQGRTPPCTAALAASGLARVVIGTLDPNPRHTGRARALLEAAGIAVTEGVLAKECAALNEAWNVWIATGMPWVVAKAGMSLDGRIAPLPGRRWITSREARADAMRLRAECHAVLVGGGTVRADNPRLTVRGIAGARQPLPVIWTRSGNLPPDATLVASGRARIFQGCSLREALRRLGREGIQSVLIEGGGRTLGEAFDRGLVHRAVFYVAPVFMGGPVPAVGGRGCARPEEGWRLDEPEYQIVGGCVRISGRVVRASAG